MYDLVYAKGKRGKSKADVRLSVSIVFDSLSLCVWEGSKITHSFYPGREFLEALRDDATAMLTRLDELDERYKGIPRANVS